MKSIVRPGRYMLVDVDSLPEFTDTSVVNFVVSSGVYYSECGHEVFVGDYDSMGTSFGRIGLIPEAVALAAGYTDDDLADDVYGVTFTEPAECYFNLADGSFGFGSIRFEPCYE